MAIISPADFCDELHGFAAQGAAKRQAATAASSQLLRRAIAAATRQRFPQRREVPPPPANVVPGSPRPGCAKLERGTSWSLRRRPILQFRGVSHSSYLDLTIYCHHFKVVLAFITTISSNTRQCLDKLSVESSFDFFFFLEKYVRN